MLRVSQVLSASRQRAQRLASSSAPTAKSFLLSRGLTTTTHSNPPPSPGASPPSQADAVVIGGGSIGTSVAYHLALKGKSVVLLERDQLTSGTTWHSAGMLWRLRPSHVDIELHAYARDKCIELETSTGIKSWSQNGGLFIACNEERLSEYKRLATLGKFYGIDSVVLKPNEIADVHPLVSADGVFGAIYSSSDGTIDPSNVVMAYARGAQQLGAQIFEHTAVSRIVAEPTGRGDRQRINGVELASGHFISSPVVVNACGAWAASLSESIGVPIPLLAMRHAYIVTETLPGMHGGLPNVRDHDLSIYLKTQGDAIAAGGYEQNPQFWNPDPKFSFGLFDLDWDTFDQNLQGHLKRCPEIGKVGIKSTVCGPESFTPDHKPLVGEANHVSGYYLACGMNSMGIMLGGGLGRELASLIVDGHSTVDLFAFDPSRFHDSTIKQTKWVQDRTHESYAKTYSILFPHDEPLAGRDARKSALHEDLLNSGCVFQSRHGFERPGWFEKELGRGAGVKEYDFYGAYGENGCINVGGLKGRNAPPKHKEHQYLSLVEGECTFGWTKAHNVVAKEVLGVRNGVGVFDQSYFGKYFVTGKDASAAIDWLCTGRVVDKGIGNVTYTTFCNAAGGVEADLTVTMLGENRFYVAAGGNTMTHDLRWMNKVFDQKGFSSVEIHDASDDMVLLNVQGPLSRDVLQQVIAEGANGKLGTNPLSNEHFPFSTCQAVEMFGQTVYLLRLTFVGELGWELHVPNSIAREVFHSVHRNAKALGVLATNAGYRAIDCMSAEKGYRHWHADLTCVDTPYEAAIGFVATPKLKTNTPFLGREALAVQQQEGVARKLVCFTLDDVNVPLHGREAIYRDNMCVGFVRSTAFGHTIGRTIAYGYIEGHNAGVTKITNKWLEQGSYQIEDRLVKHNATLHLKAPFDPENRRIKGDYSCYMY